MTFDERMAAQRAESQKFAMDLSAQLAMSIAINEVRRVLERELRKTTTAEQVETILRIRRDIETALKARTK